MGFVYETVSGRLCCDLCGAPGARRKRCPFDWCQATAVCPNCRTRPDVKNWTATHREHGCEQAAAEFTAREEFKRVLLEAGEYLRTSAIGIGDDEVRVTFRNAEGHTIEHTVSCETYRSIPLLTPATPESYGV